MTLDGLEEVVRCAAPRRNRVNFIRYADDFIITGKSKCLLEKILIITDLGEEALFTRQSVSSVEIVELS